MLITFLHDIRTGARYLAAHVCRVLGQIGCLILCCTALSAHAGGGITAVYPEASGSYLAVFEQVISGVESKTRTRITRLPVKENIDAAQLNNLLKQNDTKVAIALGKQGIKLAQLVDPNISVVVGGILNSASPGNARNIKISSLAPDPIILFQRLKKILPNTKRIFVVYNPSQNDWLIRLAKEAARQNGMELIALEASEIRTAVQKYQDVFTSAQSKGDALWLLQDSITVDETIVLPLVLQYSWERAFPIFSSNIAHVKRGVLFALYPNNTGMGHALAHTASELLVTNANNLPAISPLRDLSSAVNSRTAKHVGATLENASFDTTLSDQ